MDSLDKKYFLKERIYSYSNYTLDDKYVSKNLEILIEMRKQYAVSYQMISNQENKIHIVELIENINNQINILLGTTWEGFMK